MRKIGVFEAKTHFSALIDDAAAGKTTIITKNGKPVAEIRPIDESRKTRALQALERIRALRSTLEGEPISARELIDEGRK
ncbi:MAG: type II toxin-antitoxin system prevent-host-death family antitoxin [Candidatus Eremiobacteraeota bacterium]|nr:type II toxin-antitoxin system prevent-host-death family antitoxin [Candidatus Eremiobacteraeota bacterium]MBV8655424.1 type II toxin-antitoxin system prevent-host-death family antitoxin [Candidatus Eremiobacteraeota bacterium]